MNKKILVVGGMEQEVFLKLQEQFNNSEQNEEQVELFLSEHGIEVIDEEQFDEKVIPMFRPYPGFKSEFIKFYIEARSYIEDYKENGELYKKKINGSFKVQKKNSFKSPKWNF